MLPNQCLSVSFSPLTNYCATDESMRLQQKLIGSIGAFILIALWRSFYFREFAWTVTDTLEKLSVVSTPAIENVSTEYSSLNFTSLGGLKQQVGRHCPASRHCSTRHAPFLNGGAWDANGIFIFSPHNCWWFQFNEDSWSDDRCVHRQQIQPILGPEHIQVRPSNWNSPGHSEH